MIPEPHGCVPKDLTKKSPFQMNVGTSRGGRTTKVKVIQLVVLVARTIAYL